MGTPLGFIISLTFLSILLGIYKGSQHDFSINAAIIPIPWEVFSSIECQYIMINIISYPLGEIWFVCGHHRLLQLFVALKFLIQIWIYPFILDCNFSPGIYGEASISS